MLATLPAGTAIPARGYLLAAGSAYAGQTPADLTYFGALAAAGGGVALVKPGGLDRVDSVGWGTATNAFVEGAAAPAPSAAAGESIQRTPEGRDTGDNSSDFVAGRPPRR